MQQGLACFFALGTALALTACGGSSGTTPSDGANTRDAKPKDGGSTDGGTAAGIMDTGGGTEANGGAETGGSIDAGTRTDVATETDAATGTDGMTGTDARMRPDVAADIGEVNTPAIDGSRSNPSCSIGESRCVANNIETCDGVSWSLGTDCAASHAVCRSPDMTSAVCEPVSCPAVFGAADACGGDLTGIWHLASTCVDKAKLTEWVRSEANGCLAEVTEATVSDVSGTANFSGQTVARDVRITAAVTLAVPALCLVPPVGSCAGIAMALDTVFGTTGSSCAATAEGCTCHSAMHVHEADTSSYATNGGTLIINGQATYPFCVDGWKTTARRDGNDEAECAFTQVYVR